MNRILYILLFFSYQSFSQTERITEFFPLTPIDTINSSKEVKISEKIDSLNSEDFFFTYKDKKYKSGLLLTKKNENNWIVYDFESDLFNSSNTTVKGFRKENGKFISIQVSRSPSGACSSSYGILTLLNIETCKTIEFWNYNLFECYNNFGEVSSKSECKATIEIDSNFIKINSTKKPDDGLYCTESAEYKIEDNRLVKTKYYSNLAQRFFPVLCIENICTGTKFSALKNNFPKATFEKVPLYEYGYDSVRLGFEVCVKGEVLFFLAVHNNLITGVSVISSKYNYNGIDTETTIYEVLEKYPNSKLHIDLISDWEFIYLKKEKIKLNFKTDGTNRIGIYDFDPEDAANGIKRKDAVIDLIQTF